MKKKNNSTGKAKMSYIDLDREMARAFREAEDGAAPRLIPGVYSAHREEILDEIEHRIGVASRLWAGGGL